MDNKILLRRVAAPTAALALSVSAVFLAAPANAEGTSGPVPVITQSSDGVSAVSMKAKKVKTAPAAAPTKQVKAVKNAQVKQNVMADIYNCEDFDSQAEAQAEYNRDTSDPNQLDGNPKNGQACDSYDYGVATTTNVGTEGELPHAGGPSLAGGAGGLALAAVGGGLLLRSRRRIAV